MTLTSATGASGRGDTVSYSRLDSYENCPRAYWHSYVNGTPRDGYERVEAWTGHLVHKVLEDALRATLNKQVPRDPKDILRRYEQLWEEALGPHVLVVREGMGIDDYRRNGARWLRDYIDAEYPFLRDSIPLHVEEPVDYPVELADGSEVGFHGIMDRVDRLHDERLRLIDYKTGSWVPSFENPRDAFQLALYWHGLQARYPDAPGGELVWHYLQHRRSMTLPPAERLLRAAQQWVGRTASEIRERTHRGGDTERQFPTRPGPLCRWCEFGYTCEDNPYRKTAPAPRVA